MAIAIPPNIYTKRRVGIAHPTANLDLPTLSDSLYEVALRVANSSLTLDNCHASTNCPDTVAFEGLLE
jgi:hypothetical protein